MSTTFEIGSRQRSRNGTTPYEDAPLCRLHLKAAAGAMGGQFTDGYIIGIIGTVLTLAGPALDLDPMWTGLIAAGSLAGILFGSLGAGRIVDRIGRKSIYNLTILVFAVAAILQYFVQSPAQLLALRLILGVAIGADYSVSISLVSELSPQRHRGRMMSTIMVAWVAGFVTSYVAGIYIERWGPDAWRWALASSVIPALITAAIRIGTPESPLWLLTKGRNSEAAAIVSKHIGPHIALPLSVESPETSSWLQLFGKAWRKNTFVGAMYFFCQVIPFFALGTFIPKVLASIKLEDPSAGGVIYNVFLLVGVLLGLWIVERIRRRTFLIGSFYVCAATLLVLTLWTGMPAYLIVVFFSVFALVMSASTVLDYVYLPELFPTELRASGIGLAVAVSRIGGAGATFLLPIIMGEYGVQTTLACCVGALLLGGAICHLFAPEPRNTLTRTSH
nr:MFS transporter [Burkholderia ambifaria]